ncbi:MAG: hypothetical protein V1875_05055 [Candidatus Altiarchaeota archaeon]
MNKYVKSAFAIATVAVMAAFTLGLASYMDDSYKKKVDILERDVKLYDSRNRKLTQDNEAIASDMPALAKKIEAERDKMSYLEAIQASMAPYPAAYKTTGISLMEAEPIENPPEGIASLVGRLVDIRKQGPGAYETVSNEYDSSTSPTRVTSASGSPPERGSTTSTSTTLITSASQTTTTLRQTTTTQPQTTTTSPPPTSTTAPTQTTTTQAPTTTQPTTTTIVTGAS